MASKKNTRIKRVEITNTIASEMADDINDLIKDGGEHGAGSTEAEKAWKKTGQSVRHFRRVCDMITELCNDRETASDNDWTRDWVETVMDSYVRIEKFLDRLFVVKGRRRKYFWGIGE
jgi:hypothetical protein